MVKRQISKIILYSTVVEGMYSVADNGPYHQIWLLNSGLRISALLRLFYQHIHILCFLGFIVQAVVA